jgi:hypothetical protein
VLLQLTSAARGYGLAFLMMAVLVIAACEILSGKRSGNRWLILFFAAATLDAWTLPTFVLPAAAATCVLLVRRFQWRLVPGAATGAALIVGWYLPGAAGLFDSSGQRFGSNRQTRMERSPCSQAVISRGSTRTTFRPRPDLGLSTGPPSSVGRIRKGSSSSMSRTPTRRRGRTLLVSSGKGLSFIGFWQWSRGGRIDVWLLPPS